MGFGVLVSGFRHFMFLDGRFVLQFVFVYIRLLLFEVDVERPVSSLL